VQAATFMRRVRQFGDYSFITTFAHGAVGGNAIFDAVRRVAQRSGEFNFIAEQ
jgi:hypothetical protein